MNDRVKSIADAATRLFLQQGYSKTQISHIAKAAAVSYDEEPVTFYSAESNELVIKEYMTKNRKSFYAHGSVICDRLAGKVEYTSTSGNADIKSAVGSGSYKANNSGSLDVEYTEVTGDLYFFNKNDDIDLTLPEDLSFEFEAETKNGSVSTTFQECITVDGRITRGAVGADPVVSVRLETNNGNIEVTQ